MEERSGSRGRYHRQGAGLAEQLTLGQVKNDDNTPHHTTTYNRFLLQAQKVVPEGVEGLVEYKGSVEKAITVLIGGIQAGLAHSGAADVPTFQQKASMWTQSFAGVAEGNPHDITDIRH